MDQIAQMIMTIKNAGRVRKKEIEISHSKFKVVILDILKKENFITGYKIDENKIKITLTYRGKDFSIDEIRKVSNLGRRLYRRAKDMPYSRHGLGIYIVSTSCGVMTDRQARRKGLGGEIICEVF